MNKTRKFWAIGITTVILFSLVILTTCKGSVGLGGTVDINPPKIESIYPPIGAVIKDSFVFAVKASDDTGVKHVGILVKGADGEAAQQYLLDDQKGYWSCDIHPQKDNLKDGPYTVEITAQDGSGKEIKAETAFVIDNTPPLLVLNRPSTAALEPKNTEEARDVFGDVFLLAGQVYDETPVEELVIVAENDEGQKRTKILKNVPQNIRLKVDTFSQEGEKKEEDKFYRGIYGNNAEAGKKNFSYSLTLYDSAREYKKPWSTAATEDSKGNNTSSYYLSDDLYDAVLSKYKLPEVYAMIQGKYKKEGAARSAVEAEINAVLNILRKPEIMLGGNGTRAGTFALNPSIHPRFDIAGTAPTLLPDTGEPEFPRIYSESTLTVKLSRNLDDVPLESNPEKTYGFFLVDWDNYQHYRTQSDFDINTDFIYDNPAEKKLKAGFIQLEKVTAEREGGNYLVNIPISVDTSPIYYGKKYVLLVRGKDKKEHDFKADTKGTGGVYGFLLRKTGKAPEVTVIKMNGQTGSGADSNITEPVAVKKDADVLFTVKLTQATEAELTYTLKLGDTVVKSETKLPLSGEKEFTLPAVLFNQTEGGRYKLVLKAEADGNTSVEQTYHINYDVKGPEVTIESPMDNENRNLDSKVLTIKGTANDYGAGLKPPVVVTLKKPDGTDVPVSFANEGGKEKNDENWELQPIDLSTSGEGTYTLELTAEDSLGQKTSVLRTFIYDAAAPEVRNISVNGNSIQDNSTVYSTSETVTVAGIVTETNGLKSFKINGDDYTSLAAGAFSKSLTLSEGEHTVAIKVIDNAGKESAVAFKTVVDKTAPVLNEIKIGGGTSYSPDSAPATIVAYSNPVTLTGKTSDAGGSGIKKIEYKFDDPHSDWAIIGGSSADNGINFNFDGYVSIAVNSTKKVMLKITDMAGNSIAWERQIQVVSTIPELTLEFPATSGIEGIVPRRKGAFEVKIGGHLAGASGSDNLTVEVSKKIGNTSPVPVNLTDFFDGWQPIPLKSSNAPTTCNTKTGLESGEYTITVKAGDGTAKNRTVIVDNKGPEIEVLYPKADTAQAGEITVQGTITDELGTPVKENGTKFCFVKTADGQPPVDSDKWQNMATSTSGSWSFKYNLSQNITNASDYGNTNAAQTEYFDIPFYVLTEDALGNKAVRKSTILFNPDGTKPIVQVLAPSPNAVVGGAIQIFGTSTVAVGTPLDIGEVHIQFSKNGSFNNTADGTFSGEDWYNGGNGKVVSGTDEAAPKGGASWTLIINADGKFNNPNGEKWFVYFRVRAKNRTNPAIGVWSLPIKIEIDKSAPTIGSPEPAQIKNRSGAAEEKNFSPNMWVSAGKKLTGSLYDESGIKALTISGDLENGKTYTLAEALSAQLIEEDTDHAPTSSASGTAKNYKMKIPLVLDNLSAAAKAAKEFKVKIVITEDTAHNLTSEREFVFRYDTDKPTGDFGEEKYTSNKDFGAASVTDATLAAKIGTNPPTDYKILANSKVLNVTAVTGNKVSFTPALTAGTYNYILYKPETVIYNKNGNWIVHGVAEDTGSGVEKVEAWVTVNDVETAHTVMSELDAVNKITKSLGGMVTWKGRIDTTPLSDGKGKLYYTITDKSGNTYTAPGVDVIVKNKPVKVSKVTLQTEIGGQTVETDKTGATETDPQTTVTESVDAQLNQTKTVVSKNFAFKSKTKSKIIVEYSGGEDTVKYRLKKGDTLIGSGYDTQNLKAIPSDKEILLTETDLTAITNSNGTPTTITLEFWDDAHGFTQGTDSAWAKVNITTLFDALDETDPAVVILPFHWNTETDNSRYEGKKENGHVEIAKFTGSSNDYSSVSGKVTIRGFAYDNIELKEITATLPNSTELTVTATRQTNGTWKSDKVMFDTNGTTPKDGAELTVTKLGADYRGYYVAWQLDWDTEKAAVGADKKITVQAKDGANKTSALPPSPPPTPPYSGTDMPTKTPVTRGGEKEAENAVFANKKRGQFVVFKNGETQYLTRLASVDGNKVTLEDSVPKDATDAYMYDYKANKSAVTVNVVPYITEIETGLKGADGSFKGAFSRASTGEYPVRAGESIQVKGFNLAGGTVHLGTVSLGTTLDNVSITDSHTSGELKVTVNSVDSINNKVDITKLYNLEGNGINNDILNARRKLFVWKMKPIINNNFMESPQFVMDSKSNYYMSYGSLAANSSGMSFNMMKNRTINNTASQMGNSFIIEQCYSKYHNTVIAFDDSENMYGGATNTDKAGGSTSFTFFSREQGSDATGTSGNYDGGTNRRRLENSANASRGVYDVNRVQIPKLAVRGPGSNAKVALIYYDRNNDSIPIKFRYGYVTAPDGITKGLEHNVSSDGTGSDPSNSGSAKGYEVIADNNDATVYKSGGYAAVALTSTERAIAVWYDSVNSRLVYSYRDVTNYEEPSAGAADRKTAEWQANAVEIDGGAPLYVDIVLDSDDGLHIGYYSSGEGGVKYAYLASDKVKGTSKPAKQDFKIAKVDTYMNPGTFLKIGVRKESGKQVPYITYYHNGFYGSANAARIAWLKDGISGGSVPQGIETGKFTGDWVVMTVPASSGIQQYTICQGVPTGGTYANKVIAAYFTNKNYEMAVLEK